MHDTPTSTHRETHTNKIKTEQERAKKEERERIKIRMKERDSGGSRLTGTTLIIAGARGYQLWKDKTGQSQQHTHIQTHRFRQKRTDLHCFYMSHNH